VQLTYSTTVAWFASKLRWHGPSALDAPAPIAAVDC
jgi:hypothetical protein